VKKKSVGERVASGVQRMHEGEDQKGRGKGKGKEKEKEIKRDNKRNEKRQKERKDDDVR